MSSILRPIALCLGCAATPCVFAQAPGPPSAAVSIRSVLNQQVADWNRGDLDAFASGYKNAPDILFIGSTIAHGYTGMLARYKAHYSTQAAMGLLSFSQLSVQPLDARFATVTGRFHLTRSAAGGGDADGYYLLVMEKTAAGWKIVRDDTTAVAPSCK